MKPTVLTILIALLAISASRAQFGGGSGSEEDPYEIETIEQLQDIRDYTDKHFIQIADIDASETEEWNEGKGFRPIGAELPKNIRFTGSYDGNGYIIKNLIISRAEEDNVGLFSYMTNGSLLNIRLEEVDIHGNNRVGGLVGFREGGYVKGCSVSGSVTGNDVVGGLIGDNWGLLQRSSSVAIVSGQDIVGGLAGHSWSVEKSFATGDVTAHGDYYAGGLVGLNGFLIHASYATGDVSGNQRVGGLAGINGGSPDPGETGVITESYATGLVSGEESVGGLVGWNQRGIYSSYRDKQSSEIENNIAFYSMSQRENGKKAYNSFAETPHILMDHTLINDVEGLTTDQMTGKNAWIYMHKFDFDHTWQLTEGYPRLRWEEPEDSVQAPKAAIIWMTMEGHEYERLEVVDFGTVKSDSTTSETLTLQNTGNITMSGDVQLSGADVEAFTITGGEGSYDLGPDSSRSIEIVFQPSEVSDYKAILEITHDASNESSPWQFVLEGSGKESTSVEEDRQVPGKFLLHQNYPNPFNPSTQIRFAVPEQAHVRLTVYNLLGQQVATLLNETLSPGWHDVTFDASGLSSGAFIYRIEAGEFAETKQMMFVK